MLTSDEQFDQLPILPGHFVGIQMKELCRLRRSSNNICLSPKSPYHAHRKLSLFGSDGIPPMLPIINECAWVENHGTQCRADFSSVPHIVLVAEEVCVVPVWRIPKQRQKAVSHTQVRSADDRQASVGLRMPAQLLCGIIRRAVVAGPNIHETIELTRQTVQLLKDETRPVVGRQ